MPHDVCAGPLTGHCDHRRLTAEGAIPGLAPAHLGGAEEFRVVHMLQVMRVVDGGQRGDEPRLAKLVDDVRFCAFDAAIRCRRRRDQVGCQFGSDRGGRSWPQRWPRWREQADTAIDVRPEPFVVHGQQEVLLRAVQLGQPAGERSHQAFQPAGLAGEPHAGIDHDSQGRLRHRASRVGVRRSASAARGCRRPSSQRRRLE